MAHLLAAERDSEAVCPICLVEHLRLEDRAVVSTCMHVFCRQCLWRWLDYKHTCPLCKGQMNSIFYQITETGEFSERQLPPPPPEKPREEGRLPLIDEGRAQPGVLPDSYEEARRQRRVRRQFSQAPEEPRPYYHRVRAMMGAPGSRAATGAAVEPQIGAEDAGILWRRHIYLQGIRAEPLDLRRVGAPGTTAQKRLEGWIERELRAVLRLEDVSLLRSFVMGLALSTGLCEQAGNEPRAEEEAIRTLQPFLQAHARHFWHELRCFARQPFSVATYDRTVQYPAQDQQANEAGAGGGAANGFSLWQAQSNPGGVAGSSSRAASSAAVASEVDTGSGTMSSAAHSVADCSDEPLRTYKRRRATADAQPRLARDPQALLAERRCILHGRAGSIGLCLDCAEQQALEQTGPLGEETSPLQRERRELDRQDATPEAQAVPAPASNLPASSAAIGRLAAERLRALLGRADPVVLAGVDGAAGDQHTNAVPERSTVVDLCADDSSDEGDVFFLSTSRAPNEAEASRNLAGSSAAGKRWLIRRNRLPTAAVRRTRAQA